MKIYKVFYKVGETTREIGKGRNLRKAEYVIYKFLKEKHYSSPYWRHWCDGRGHWYDVGSWSEFFNIKEEVI